MDKTPEIEEVNAEIIDLAITRPVMPEVKFDAAVISCDGFDALEKWADAVYSMYSATKYDVNDPRTYKMAKDERASINSYIKEIDARRITVKKTYNAPLDAFEARVKVITAKLKSAADVCDRAVKTIEETELQNKLLALREEYESFAPILCPVVPFERIMDGTKWTNRTCSLDKAIKELRSKIMSIDADWQTLKQSGLRDECYSSAERVFFDTLDLGQAIREANKIAEKQKRIEAMKAEMQPAPEPDQLPELAHVAPTQCQPAQPVDVWEPEAAYVPECVPQPDPMPVMQPIQEPVGYNPQPEHEEFCDWQTNDEPPIPDQELIPWVIVIPEATKYEIDYWAGAIRTGGTDCYAFQGTMDQAFLAYSLSRRQ